MNILDFPFPAFREAFETLKDFLFIHTDINLFAKNEEKQSQIPHYDKQKIKWVVKVRFE